MVNGLWFMNYDLDFEAQSLRRSQELARLVGPSYPLDCIHNQTLNGAVKSSSQIYCCHAKVAASRIYNYYQLGQISCCEAHKLRSQGAAIRILYTKIKKKLFWQ